MLTPEDIERLEEIKAIRERADWPTYPWKYHGARDDLMVLLWHMDEQARRIERLEAVLPWMAANYASTLAGKPVRDADECLVAAEKALEVK